MKPYLGSARQWHWISSAICLFVLLLFAITGITLNHAQSISAKPSTQTIEFSLPTSLLTQLQSDKTVIPTQLIRYFRQQAIVVDKNAAEWHADELYFSLPRAGGDAWLSIDLANGNVLYEQTSRGVIAYLNDLHKGRNTGLAWRVFLDVFSLACVVFCLSGFLLLYRQSAVRVSTWPLLGLGVLLPVLLVLLFVHR